MHIFIYPFILYRLFYAILFHFILFYFIYYLLSTIRSFLLPCFHLFCDNLPCSGMFRNVPGCSEMFHVPGFVNALRFARKAIFHISAKFSTSFYVEMSNISL